MQKMKLKKNKIQQEKDNHEYNQYAQTDEHIDCAHVDWDKLKTEQAKRDTAEFPFTKCHTEDCVFVMKNQNEGGDT